MSSCTTPITPPTVWNTRYENLIYPEYERNIESYEELEENENTTLESMDDINLDDEDFEL